MSRISPSSLASWMRRYFHCNVSIRTMKTWISCHCNCWVVVITNNFVASSCFSRITWRILSIHMLFVKLQLMLTYSWHVYIYMYILTHTHTYIYMCVKTCLKTLFPALKCFWLGLFMNLECKLAPNRLSSHVAMT